MHIPSKITKNNSQGIIFVIISCQRVMISNRMVRSWVLYGQPQWVVQVLKFVLVATLACHWAACMWLYLEAPSAVLGLVTKMTQLLWA